MKKWKDMLNKKASPGLSETSIGALSGASLAAILSALYYNRKSQKKKSFASRFLKSLLWAGAGALGGAGIGRMIGLHNRYSRDLEEARKASEKMPKRSGRAIVVNFPENKSNLGSPVIKKLFPGGAPVQHAAILLMDSDGDNATLYHTGADSGDPKEIGKNLILEGIGRGKYGQLDVVDKDKVAKGVSISQRGITNAPLKSVNFAHRLKGLKDEDLAKVLADYGAREDYGDKVEMYEGKNGVDLNVAKNFLRISNRNHHVHGGGYGALPGGYNCGTLAREAFDAVNGKESHYLDLLLGGFPSANMPFLSKRTSGRSFKIDNRNPVFNSAWDEIVL